MMTKKLVLAEKPSVARDIAKVLGVTQQKNGYIEGKNYIVTWALGHLVTLATPDQYDKTLETWRMEDLPMLPKELKTTVIPKTRKQFNTVKAQIERQDVSEIIIATDAGREGELVARWIIERTRGARKPVKRLWISSVTDKAIKEGFNRLQPGKKYDHLYESAVARAEADWYVGLNATRALTTKFGAQLSSGRVQTPTLAMVQARENDINTFKPQTYYTIQAQIKGATFQWDKGARIHDKAKADALVSKLKNEKATITNIQTKEKKQFAPQLYDLTELQRDANRMFQFSAKQTLRIMQNLYERHKVLTYPRTDSRVITSDIVPTIQERLRALPIYKEFAGPLLKKNYRHLPASVVNDRQASDHHAIIPTEESAFIAEFSADERKIYELVVKRFLAVLSDVYIYEETEMTAHIAKETFTAKTTQTKQLGWRAIESHKGDLQLNSTFSKGEVTENVRVSMNEGLTQPPERLTEGTLLKAMENPAKFLERGEEHLAKTLKSTGGIGTVATRADIIEKLINSQYMELRGKYLYLTPTGKQLLDLAPEHLQSPALTAEWEMQLQQIERGELKRAAFIAKMKQFTKEIVHDIKRMEATFKHDNVTGTKCPKCDDFMLEIENKHGKMLRCKNRECNHKRQIYKNSNARCPNCKKKLKLYGEGDGQQFICVCGHREKLSAFQKRRNQEKQGRVSKRDVQKYMKKQDDFSNNALAEALKKLQQ